MPNILSHRSDACVALAAINDASSILRYTPLKESANIGGFLIILQAESIIMYFSSRYTFRKMAMAYYQLPGEIPPSDC